jgi:hypothetical protein
MAKYFTVCYLNIGLLIFFKFYYGFLAGVAPEINSHLDSILSMRLPEFVNVKDRSLEVINLIRVLNGISRFWGELYNVEHYQALVKNDHFKHKLLTDKVNRQLTV